MNIVIKFAKKIPVLPDVYKAVCNAYGRYKLKSKSAEDAFTDIYKGNSWRGKNSVSGTGSDDSQTKVIAGEIPVLLRELHISTILDIPCGDFHWMKSVDLHGADYLGADIVKELIQKNSQNNDRKDVRFQNLDLIKDELPKVDLVFCRDCLVHLSFADIFSTLENVCKSESEYFLTTTFTDRKANHDIATGQWRSLNLELPPFGLPQPIRTINEGCTEEAGAYKDKALGLWKVSDIRECLAKSSPRT